MRTKEDVEQYLIDLDTAYETIGDGMYRLIDDMEEVDDILVLVTEPLVVFSVRLMKVPEINKEAFYRKLLDFNATALVAGAYGIDGVVITDTLQLENLDFNEFQASVESLAMAIHDHYPILMDMCKAKDDDSAEDKKTENA